MWIKEELSEFQIGYEFFLMTDTEKTVWESLLTAARMLGYEVRYHFDNEYKIIIRSTVLTFRIEMEIGYTSKGKRISKILVYRRRGVKIDSFGYEYQGYANQTQTLEKILEEL